MSYKRSTIESLQEKKWTLSEAEQYSSRALQRECLSKYKVGRLDWDKE